MNDREERVPNAQIPLHGPCRLRTFEILTWLLAVDAHNTADALVNEGWNGEALEHGLDHYRQWILEHPEISWFPTRGQPTGPAKAVCARCLVHDECRAWALNQGRQLEGIWGGLSRRQRQYPPYTRPR